MRAIKKTDENLVKVAKDICSTFSRHHFVSPFNFKVKGGGIVLLSSSVGLSCIVFSMIPSNFMYSVYCQDNKLVLCIWF